MKKTMMFLSLLCLSCLASCARTGTNAPNSIDPTGIYTLVAVNGSTIPNTVLHGDRGVEVHSGVFTINADGTCSSKVLFGQPSSEPIHREVHATYTQRGSGLSMKWKGAGRTTGVIEDNMFTMNNEGMIFTYQR